MDMPPGPEASSWLTTGFRGDFQCLTLARGNVGGNQNARAHLQNAQRLVAGALFPDRRGAPTRFVLPH